MLTSKDSPFNPLKNHKEPQQLDLFRSRASSESSVPTDLCPTVRDELVTHVCKYYDLFGDPKYGATLRQYIEQNIEQNLHASVTSRAWPDYLRGLASTMSFFPTTTMQTFVRSDLAAMASDWIKAQSDLKRVWQAFMAVEKFCDERSGKQQKRRRAAPAE